MLIGKNGRGKTAVLQSIALAAAGSLHVNDLGKAVVASYPPLDRPDAVTRIEATFGLDDLSQQSEHQGGARQRRRRTMPFLPNRQAARVRSHVTLRPGYNSFDAQSHYADAHDAALGNDPLKEARALGLPCWTAFAYGVSRHLRLTEGSPYAPNPTEIQLERLRSIFTPEAVLRGIGFFELMDAARSKIYGRFIQTLMRHAAPLLPELSNVELRGYGGVTRADDLLKRHRFMQDLPRGGSLKLPATWLSHGYQSSLAWLTDLIGHALLEDDTDDASRAMLEPSDLRGLVLIDELDIHLHPTWQRAFVAALRDTFPNLQFIATTHSPLLLSGLRPDEIILLEMDDTDHITARQYPKDPRLMTGSELYQEFFGVPTVFAQDLGMRLDDYQFLARNPHRTDDDERELAKLSAELRAAGVTPSPAPAPREEPP